MKNILLLTTIYPLPTPDNRGTSVCHFFASDWVKMGYNVTVIHFLAIYPHFLYWAARLFRKQIVSKTGAVVYVKRDIQDHHYMMDGVSVNRLSVYKAIPHRGYSNRVLKESVRKIVQINLTNDFVPDVIVGHFPNPQLRIVSDLATIYPNAKTGIVMHADNGMIASCYGKKYIDYFKNIDTWGFRSNAIKYDFQRLYGEQPKEFLCYSGIPEDYIVEINNRKFSGNMQRFIFVGEFIERKYPSSLVYAVSKACEKDSYSIVFVGEGNQDKAIVDAAKKLGILNKIEFTGKIARAEIKKHLDQSDCMIMISRDEAFGLVYLEAMARGCITIGSRNEGIDGIIKHGVNGFLCEAGNDLELSKLISQINELTPYERLSISNNAIATAKELTDRKAAKLYLDNLLN